MGEPVALQQWVITLLWITLAGWGVHYVLALFKIGQSQQKAGVYSTMCSINLSVGVMAGGYLFNGDIVNTVGCITMLMAFQGLIQIIQTADGFSYSKFLQSIYKAQQYQRRSSDRRVAK